MTRTTTDKNILISIPAKNEEKTIDAVISKSVQQAKQLTSGEVGVLVVNDGSTDKTARKAKDAGAEVFSHPISVGLGAVFQEAVAYATEHDFEIMLTIDGDGQFREADIPALLDPLLRDRADMVTGSRFIDGSITKDIPRIKLWGNKLVAKLISSILRRPMKDVSCGFRAYSKKALYHLNLFGGFTYTQEVLLNLGYKNLRIAEVPIETTYFKKRKSRIAHNLFSYGTQVLRIVFMSMLFYRPLQLFGTISVLLLLLGIPLGAFVGIHYLDTGMITPYKAVGIIALTLVVMGILFFFVGLFMQIISRLQLSIDRLLYYQKRKSR